MNPEDIQRNDAIRDHLLRVNGKVPSKPSCTVPLPPSMPIPMAFLVWSYDPCPEGGWHMVDTAFTFEEAKAKCMAIHAQGLAVIDRCKDGDHDPKMLACYSKAMVTQSPVFEIEA